MGGENVRTKSYRGRKCDKKNGVKMKEKYLIEGENERKKISYKVIKSYKKEREASDHLETSGTGQHGGEKNIKLELINRLH